MSYLAFHEKAGRCQVICGCVSSYLMFSFARISGVFVAGEAAVKAERSEFILSLDGRRRQPQQGSPGKGKHQICSFPNLFHIRAELMLSLTLPSALLLSDSCARCTLGVLGTVGAAICLATSPCIGDAKWSRPRRSRRNSALAIVYSSLS